MGFAPQQVGAMSYWQFLVCVDGWRRAHVPDAKGGGEPIEFGPELDALYDAAPAYLH